MPVHTVLTINVGSSNVKIASFREAVSLLRRTVPNRESLREDTIGEIERIRTQLPNGPFAVGHRIVHGGTSFTMATRITPDVVTQLEQLSAFAPLHMPPAIRLIRAIAERWPEVPQVACFDTAFHATMPRVETRFGIPRKYHDAGIRRYGFHGLSYQFIASKLPGVSPRAATGRTVVCHLGNGASLCGMLGGRSVTTTMGFSPLDGLLMGTRCGRIDPGVLLYLLEKQALAEVRQILETESGLLGVSGVSADMRLLLASSKPEAEDAIALFCHMTAKEIGAAAVALGGLDAIVFTAGIGENCPTIRKRICDSLTWLGAILHNAANDANERMIHSSGSRVELLCLPTDEEAIIAEQTQNTLTTTGATP